MTGNRRADRQKSNHARSRLRTLCDIRECCPASVTIDLCQESTLHNGKAFRADDHWTAAIPATRTPEAPGRMCDEQLAQTLKKSQGVVPPRSLSGH